MLREKGQKLFASYQGLKKHLEELRSKIATLERENHLQAANNIAVSKILILNFEKILGRGDQEA